MNNNFHKLKIAFVSDAIYPYNVGGKEKRIFEISTRLAAKGHDVTIYCMKWWEGKENTRVENGVTLKAISPLYPLYSGERRSMKEAIMFALHCFRLITEDFDLIDVDHMPHLILFPLKFVTLIKRKKLFATWNEVWGKKYWREYLGILGNIAAIIENLSAKLPDEILSISPYTTKRLKEELHVTKPIQTIPMGIDFQHIQNIAPSKKTSDVLFAGRLLTHKNVNILVKAIKLLSKDFPTISSIVIGKGPEKENLVKLVTELHLEKNIIFYDFLKEHDDLYALMKSSKVFVFPSTREGFGIVALEANAANIPVITTNHKDNATKDLIKNGKNGYAIELDEELFAQKIAEYLKNKRQLDIKSSVKNYDWNEIANRVEEAYNK